MAKRNSSNQDYTNNSDGWDLTGGTTGRKLTVTGANITLTGSGTNVYTFPASTSTLYGTATGSITSSQLATSLSDESGSGPALFATSPTITTPTIRNWDGWLVDNHTWVFASATTFTIAGVDLTATFIPGTMISYNDGSVDYGVVASSIFSTNTTVTLIANNDYSIANTTLTAPRYTYVARPQAFPPFFNYTPTITGYSANPTTVGYTYQTMGNTIEVTLSEGTNGTSNATTTTYTGPVPSSNIGANGQWQVTAAIVNSGATVNTAALGRILANTNVINVFTDFGGTGWGATLGKRIRSLTILYQFG